MPLTTIQLESRTRRKLAGLKAHRRESYDELLNKLMQLIPEGDDEGKFTPEFRARLLQARIESIEGKSIPHAKAMRLVGLES